MQKSFSRDYLLFFFVSDGDKDILENEQLVQRKKNARNALRRGEKNKEGEYDPYGDKGNTVLSKYDEEMPAESVTYFIYLKDQNIGLI